MKYHLITYGCQMNTADSEEMARPFESLGFLPTGDIDQADIVLMNTCTVRDQAEHRAQSNLGRLVPWKRQNPNRILIVAGCAASRWGESIKKRYPHIDLVAPATQIEKFPELVAEVLKERWNWHSETETAFRRDGVTEYRGTPDTSSSDSTPTPRHSDTPIRSSELFGTDHTAYVTIMRGCNYSCSYCIVPQVRGREVYRPLPEILAEIQGKTLKGFKEVMLLGQTVNSYYYRTEVSEYRGVGESQNKQNSDTPTPRHADTVVDFADLLHAVNAVPGVERIRFMSPHPKHMKDRVIEAMRDCSKVCRHIHLPVQSGSDRLLAGMKRLYTREQYITIVQKLRAAMPAIQITTDLIVGYPSETEEDFQDTLNLLRAVEFAGLFAFKFSTRPGTAAAAFPDDVPAEVKEDRLQQVLALNKQIQLS